MAGKHARAAAPRPDEAPSPTVARQLVLIGSLVTLVVLVVLALHFTGHRRSNDALPSTPGVHSTTGAPTTTGATGASKPSTTTTGGSPASTTTSATGTSKSPTATASNPPATPGVPVAKVPLLVLNNSTVARLAEGAAADFRAGGWPVADVGSLRGRLKDTTVYYSPGYAAAAHALAARFPQLHRVLPRIAGLPGTAKLTVVVTRYYRPTVTS